MTTNLSENEIKMLEALNKAYEERWAVLGEEKRKDLDFEDAIITSLSHAMFRIMSGKTGKIVLTPEWVMENAGK